MYIVLVSIIKITLLTILLEKERLRNKIKKKARKERETRDCEFRKIESLCAAVYEKASHSTNCVTHLLLTMQIV